MISYVIVIELVENEGNLEDLEVLFTFKKSYQQGLFFILKGTKYWSNKKKAKITTSNSYLEMRSVTSC